MHNNVRQGCSCAKNITLSKIYKKILKSHGPVQDTIGVFLGHFSSVLYVVVTGPWENGRASFYQTQSYGIV